MWWQPKDELNDCNKVHIIRTGGIYTCVHEIVIFGNCVGQHIKEGIVVLITSICHDLLSAGSCYFSFIKYSSAV